MSLQLHLSARSAELLAALRPALASARTATLAKSKGIPRPIPVLVPSAQMGDWLQVRLARDLGLSMGFEFLQPAAYFGRQFAADPESKDFADAHAFWAPGRLRWHRRSRPSTSGMVQLGERHRRAGTRSRPRRRQQSGTPGDQVAGSGVLLLGHLETPRHHGSGEDQAGGRRCRGHRSMAWVHCAITFISIRSGRVFVRSVRWSCGRGRAFGG